MPFCNNVCYAADSCCTTFVEVKPAMAPAHNRNNVPLCQPHQLGAPLNHAAPFEQPHQTVFNHTERFRILMIDIGNAGTQSVVVTSGSTDHDTAAAICQLWTHNVEPLPALHHLSVCPSGQGGGLKIHCRQLRVGSNPTADKAPVCMATVVRRDCHAQICHDLLQQGMPCSRKSLHHFC